MFLLALFAPVFGFALALLIGFYAHSQDNRSVRNAAIAAGLLAVLWTLLALQLGVPQLYGF
jgi:hypothetical protein